MMVDPLVEATRLDRNAIVANFCESFAVDSAYALAPIWRRMLDYWQRSPMDITDAEALLWVTLFHERLHEWKKTPTPEGNSNSLSGLKVSASRTDADCLEANSDEYFGPAHALGLLRAGSRFIQQTGRVFNTAIEIRPLRFGRKDESEGRALVVELFRDFEERGERNVVNFGICAAMAVLDRDDAGDLRARIVAHVEATPREAGMVR